MIPLFHGTRPPRPPTDLQTMRTSTYAAAFAVPALLAFTTIAPEKISFAPKAGTTVTKTFTTVTEMELEDAEVPHGWPARPHR